MIHDEALVERFLRAKLFSPAVFVIPTPFV
jgi:hypothetical protein